MLRLVLVASCIGMVPVCSRLSGEENQVVFQDDFNRDDAAEVGNQWTSRGNVILQAGALQFEAKEEEFRPRTKRAFPVQKEGKLTVSFVMDWLRKSEGTWSFHMQLGHSEEMPRLLIYDKDLSKGIGVNLIWGGREPVNFEPAGTFGYSSSGEFKPLFVVNDLENKQSVVEDPIVTVEVDLDSGTYAVTFNGKTYPEIPFDNKVPIDTIRFICNGCSKSGFARSAIDDVKIMRAN